MYSKITSIEVINFMIFEHARISFDERGIINLKGYNSTGKSTIERALAVCFADAFKRNQQKFIRYGEDYFRVIVEFDDGVRIVRDKYINGQSLYEMYQGDELLYTSKEGNKLTKISDVPLPIQQYLGLITLANGCLNYQSRRDPLWLIETPGSENYYALNEVLKTESIARANALINSDKNKLGGEIAELEADFQATELALEECSAVSEELLSTLVERESKAQGLCSRYEIISDIMCTVAEIRGCRLLPSVQRVDSGSVDRLEELLEVRRVVAEVGSHKSIPSFEMVDEYRIADINSIYNNTKEISESGITIATYMSGISMDKVDPLGDIFNSLRELARVLKEEKALSREYDQVSSRLCTLVAEAKAEGKRFVQCDNCGVYMEVGE